MKRNLTLLALIMGLFFALALSGCDKDCNHEWKVADCENAKTCTRCGETRGEALGHSWKAATCNSPKTCETCGATQDAALSHSWKDATCRAPKTCTTCGATEGEVGDHTWVEANCMAAKTCTTCGKTEGGLGDHEIQDATCEAPQTCAHCGLTVGEALGHDWQEADCETPKTCLTCGMVEEPLEPGDPEWKPTGHVWYAATCDQPKHCETCGKTEGEALGHNWREATCYAPKICDRCFISEGKALGHSWLPATTDAPKTCSVCGTTEGSAVVTDPRFQTEACKALFGTWKAEMTITGEDLGLAGVKGSATQVMHTTFNPDGTAKTVSTIKNMDEFVDLMTEFMFVLFEQMGLDRVQAEQATMLEYGMSVREYAAMACEAENNTVTNEVYYVANDELYMGESWYAELIPYEIVIKGNKMTVYDPDQDMTMEFVRV